MNSNNNALENGDEEKNEKNEMLDKLDEEI
jgi:hypothetical protein